MSFELNRDALTKVANDAAAIQAQQMQTLLDSLTATEEGKPVEDVKATLERRWTEDLGGTLTDPHLTAWAEQLAAGGRVIVNQKPI
jgi:hypothetical protein